MKNSERWRNIWLRAVKLKQNHRADLIEVVLNKPDSFLIIKETLTRVGVPNKERSRLFQTCHILCKRKRFYLVHFKELFMLDGKPSNMTVTDVARRNSIINYLVRHDFCTLRTEETELSPHLPKNEDFTIISFEDKNKWELVPKYTIGNPRNKRKGFKKKDCLPTQPASE